MSECKHEDWEVGLNDVMGCGHCRICGKQMRLNVLFDDLRKRMEETVKKYEDAFLRLELLRQKIGS
jgi:hypothetical protein